MRRERGLLGLISAAAGAATLALGWPDRAASQERALPGLFENPARVDSMRAALTPEVLEELRRRAAREDEPEAWYDLGAALLLSGDWEASVEPLQRAGTGGPTGVGESADYNLGVAHAVGGRPRTGTRPGSPGARGQEGDAKRQSLMQAREALRRTLRANPGAEDARWNLELVGRWLQQLGGGSGGGSGGGGGGGGGDEGRDGGMSEQEADRLLDAAAAAERRVQEERLERNRSRDPVAEKNW